MRLQYVKFDNIDIDNVEGNRIFSENCLLAEVLSFVVAQDSSVVEGKTCEPVIIIIKNFRTGTLTHKSCLSLIIFQFKTIMYRLVIIVRIVEKNQLYILQILNLLFLQFICFLKPNPTYLFPH